MKISYNWLKDYLKADIGVEELSQILTDCGLEVEGFEKIQSVKGGLEGLVIGEVKTREKHPDADKLSLTTVDIGSGEFLHIVCGAPNVEAGQKVVVATIGTTLYAPDGSEFNIKKSKIRGALSEGMLCAEDEIGLGKSHDGILVLDAKVKVGLPAKEHFNIKDDWQIEIGLTPNRSDAFSHYGVARDAVAVLKLKGEKAVAQLPSVDAFKVDRADNKIKLKVENKNCVRFSGLTIDNVSVKESPDWLKNRLKAIGLKPINNVVDSTNYVLHELGQPLHAYDMNEIKGNEVIVKTLPEGTKFTTLDGLERQLSDKDLMICNAKEGMCIAGVFGGEKSGVKNNTTSIFLESAYFDAVSVRKTARKHGLNTDSSFRFERGTNPEMTVFALKRAALLIKEIAGGTITSNIIDYYPEKIEPYTVELSIDKCNKLIGKEIPLTTIKSILESLEIKIVSEKAGLLKLEVPPFKVDVQRDVDVIEEILRIYGYNNIEIPVHIRASLSYREPIDKVKVQNLISDLLVNKGFNEMMANSLTKGLYYEGLDAWDGGKSIRMLNPLSSELDVMRQSLIFGGLEAVRYNQNRKAEVVKLFEFGKSYAKTDKGYKETHHLAIFISGLKAEENWNSNSNKVDFYDLKAVVTTIIERLGIQGKMEFSEANSAVYDYGLNIEVNRKKLLEYGALNTAVRAMGDLKNEVFYAEFNLDNLIALLTSNKVKYKEVPKFPSVQRDLAILIDEAVSFDQLQQIARSTEKNLLKEVGLFDVYAGKNIENGKKSYALRFVFADTNQTLTDTKIDQVMSKLINSYAREVNAEIR